MLQRTRFGQRPRDAASSATSGWASPASPWARCCIGMESSGGDDLAGLAALRPEGQARYLDLPGLRREPRRGIRSQTRPYQICGHDDCRNSLQGCPHQPLQRRTSGFTSPTMPTASPGCGSTRPRSGRPGGGNRGSRSATWWPEVGSCVDDLAVIRSVWTTDNNHGPVAVSRPAGTSWRAGCRRIGSGIHYGLGSLNDNLPSFVVPGPGRSATAVAGSAATGRATSGSSMTGSAWRLTLPRPCRMPRRSKGSAARKSRSLP